MLRKCAYDGNCIKFKTYQYTILITDYDSTKRKNHVLAESIVFDTIRKELILFKVQR